MTRKLTLGSLYKSLEEPGRNESIKIRVPGACNGRVAAQYSNAFLNLLYTPYPHLAAI